MEMGFDEKEVVDALRVNNNQQDAAVGIQYTSMTVEFASRASTENINHLLSSISSEMQFYLGQLLGPD